MALIIAQVGMVEPRLYYEPDTPAAFANRLGAGKGLLYRHLPLESPDGLPGHEGACLLCSFWLVDNLAGQAWGDSSPEFCHRRITPENMKAGSAG